MENVHQRICFKIFIHKDLRLKENISHISLINYINRDYVIFKGLSYRGTCYWWELLRNNQHCVHITSGLPKVIVEMQRARKQIQEYFNVNLDELRWNDMNCGLKLRYICKRRNTGK